jgi:hypothetical protein
MTGVLDSVALVPAEVLKRCGYELSKSAEAFLPSCPCGGAFKRGAAPRCPECNHIISRDEIIRMLDAFYEEREWSEATDKVGTLQNCVVLDERVQRFTDR